MAEALLKRMVGSDIYVESCGTRTDPHGEGADRFVVEVMAELGCDLSGHVPKTFADLEDSSFDLVVSLTPEAQHQAVEFSRHHAVQIVYWPTHDPTVGEGSREARLAAYRQLRDGLAQRLMGQFG